MSMQATPFGVDLIGRRMTLYTMTNKQGASVSVLDFGAHLVSVTVPDKNGVMKDVVLGFDTLQEYDEKPSFLGAIVGRYGNRIGGAKFTLNGTEYTLFKNDGNNSLHGGLEGFDKKWFQGTYMEGEHEDCLVLTYISHDGEEGYPGKMHVQVSYAWDDTNTLTIRYMAQSDKDTVVNMTNHAYFNLAGEGSGDTLDHELSVYADYTTEVDGELIPTGRILPLKGTALDLNAPVTLRQLLGRQDECPPIRQVNGLDFNFCLRGEGLRECALLRDPESHRTMHVLTTEPGIQIYSGQGLSLEGKGGKHYGAFAGIAMETQHYPDSPNHDNFPTTTLRAGDVMTSTTQYRFTVE
ncbi:MAG: galactose mutarotase [Clostridiales bacterium]|nr:galactose mutarotase [Clostridiales bacterium]